MKEQQHSPDTKNSQQKPLYEYGEPIGVGARFWKLAMQFFNQHSPEEWNDTVEKKSMARSRLKKWHRNCASRIKNPLISFS